MRSGNHYVRTYRLWTGRHKGCCWTADAFGARKYKSMFTSDTVIFSNLQFINTVVLWCLSNAINNSISLYFLSGTKSQTTDLKVADKQARHRQTKICTAQLG